MDYLGFIIIIAVLLFWVIPEGTIERYFKNLEKLFDHYVEQKTKEKHDWGKWEATEQGDVTRGGSTVGRYIYMTRTCKITGEKEIKKVTA